MGKNKIDRTQLIESSTNRKVTFCKRKKDLLRKAIELSQMCGRQISLIIHDPETDKVISYSSCEEFTLAKAHEVKQHAIQAE
mmetsp:Transcript_8447/g.12891  ORF Transcript_8447/g.12891 Transcript_8447/m.12891 type:complete len:82 (-) Transcript_8447:586-831(-)